MAKNKVVYGDETIMDITDTTAEAEDVAAGKVFYLRSGERAEGIGNYMDKVTNPVVNHILIVDANGQAIDSGILITDKANVADLPGIATDLIAGLVKLNPNESVTLNANGQLDVGGRLGQFPNGGVFYPTNIEPTNVSASSFLMTDGAKNVAVSGRTFAIMAGVNITCKSAAAGSTQYRVSNTYANRFLCSTIKGGRIAIDQNDAINNGTAYVESVKFANGTDCYVHFGEAEPNNDIIITANRSVNPSAATTKLRGYGTNVSQDNILVGQGVAATGGKVISLGQATMAGGNQTIALGNSVHVLANNSVGMGHTLLVNKQYCFGVGQGHDFTNGANGTAAVGVWSEIDANTRFVVGIGTSTARKNAFEVLADGRAKSSGTPTESDDLATKQYVDSAIGGGGLTFQTFGNADFTYEQVLDPDTQEVINECVAYSTVAGNAEEPKAVKYGRIVNMSGAFKNINARPSNAVFVMGKVPSGCEPLYKQSVLAQGTSQAKFLLTIETDGTLKCARYSTGATALAVPHNAWLNLNVTYVAAT